jgi:hypothetical protein
LSGYTNTLRSGQEKKNDIEIDSAYQSAKNVVPDTKKKNLIRGAMSGQSQQRPKTNDSECRLHAVSRRRGLSKTETRLTGVSVGIGLKGAVTNNAWSSVVGPAGSLGGQPSRLLYFVSQCPPVASRRPSRNKPLAMSA